VEHALAASGARIRARAAMRPRSLAGAARVLGPAAGSLLLCLTWLVVRPATADLAAQEYRTGLWRREGFAIWDAGWYGGHHEPGYSLLFGPLAAQTGPGALGVLAGMTGVLALTAIAWRVGRRPVLVSWLFAAGVMSNVLVGRVPFALGIALGALAWLGVGAARRRPGMLLLAALLALATVWASPPAGLFLALAGAARWIARRDTAAALALTVPPIAGGLAVAVAFPEGGRDHFPASMFWPTLAIGLAALALVDPRHRVLRTGTLAALVLLVAAFVLPTSVGQTTMRPMAILGPALLALGLRPGRRAALAGIVVGGGLLFLQWEPAVRAIGEAQGDPSTHASYYDEVLRIVDRAREPGERLEIPLTRNHWEAAYVAPRIPLARGWHRQLDEEANPLFYGSRAALTPERYGSWLYDRAVRWVALPNVPLDFSARREAALLRAGGVPGLRLVWSSPRWRVWEVLPVPEPATGPARLVGAGTSSFQLAVRQPGRVRVRETYTPYWTVVRGSGCVERGPGGLTEVVARRPGSLRVEARMSLAGALGRARSCSG
jgi:hypothetical protein